MLLVQVRQHIHLRFDLKTSIFGMIFHNTLVLVSVELQVHFLHRTEYRYALYLAVFIPDESMYSGSDYNVIQYMII